ncbi:MAG: oligosaccharide flippase family protein [Chloroflexi bacterium]|nr:oligosaccharide flippase family protein [Chloroflexota bacterium]
MTLLPGELDDSGPTEPTARLVPLRPGRLARTAAGSFGLLVLSTGFGFVSNVLLARILGAGGYGLYVFVMAVIGILGVFCVVGLDRLVVRELAGHVTRGSWDLASGVVRYANALGLVASVAVTLLALVAIAVVSGGFESPTAVAFALALPILILSTLGRVRSTTLQALHHVVIAQVPERVVRPVLLTVLLGVVAMAAPPDLRTPALAVVVSVAAVGAAFLVGTVLLRLRLPPQLLSATPRYESRRWLKAAVPLTLLGIVGAVNQQADVILLGALVGPEEAAVFAVANRSAALIGFGLAAVNSWLAPVVSSLWASGDRVELERTVIRAARLATVVTAALAVGFVVFSDSLLLVFGPEFTGGATALTVLSAGQVFNALTGSVGVLLVMTGHDRQVLVAAGFGAVLNVVLNLLLVPQFGATGAAVAHASSMAIWNILLAIAVYRRLGIHSTALGRIAIGRRPGRT